MTIGILALLSLLAIVAVALFLAILRWPTSKAMPISYLTAAVLALGVWPVSFPQVGAATVNGAVTISDPFARNPLAVSQSVQSTS